jgi:hypothetical protein
MRRGTLDAASEGGMARTSGSAPGSSGGRQV